MLYRDRLKRGYKFVLEGEPVRVSRNLNTGVPWVKAESKLGAAAGFGFAHAHDRFLQMILLRLICNGQLSEKLADDEKTFAIDSFMREMGFFFYAKEELADLDADTLKYAESYCSGVNEYLSRFGAPLEFKLVGYQPEPWRPVDLLSAIKLMGFIALAETQADAERLIVQSIQGGVDLSKLRELFYPHLEGLTDEGIELIKRTKLRSALVQPWQALKGMVPSPASSNNWIVNGKWSQSGAPLAAHDPHADISRLAAIWSEIVVETPDNFYMGISFPGLPSVVMGRSRFVSHSFTYGFMDMVDFFIEDCSDGRYRRGEKQMPFRIREEVIRRKKHPSRVLQFYENDLGILERESAEGRLADGTYFLRAFSSLRKGSVPSLQALSKMMDARSVDDLARPISKISISANWLLGDHQGEIAYQQSGIAPRRNSSGLFPVAAWIEKNLWNGFLPAEALKAVRNPAQGYLVTANDEWNPESGPVLVNLHMGPHRAARIKERLESLPRGRVTVEDFRVIQSDLVSEQAREFIEAWKPFFVPGPVADLLNAWDFRYTADSQSAFLFEMLYRKLGSRVFGQELFGLENWNRLVDETIVFSFYFHYFDRLLKKTNSKVIADEVNTFFKEWSQKKIPTYGRWRTFQMNHLMFEGKLPAFLGFDKRNCQLQGSRATVSQGAWITTHGRSFALGPVHRFVTDLKTEEAHSVVAGGPSDRRWSRFYRSDLPFWDHFKLKKLTLADKAF